MNKNKKVDQLVNTGKDFVHDLVDQWTVPAKGNYVSNKEIASYSLGGCGKELLLMLATYFALNTGNTLFGMVLGIRPTHIQTMSVIIMIMDIFLIGIRAYIIDNTNTKWGRFSSY